MPTVQVYWFKGRSQKTREKVGTAIVDAMASIEGTHVHSPKDVEVFFFDLEPGSIISNGKPLYPSFTVEEEEG